MIYCIGGVKGGTGKSTIATNLAVILAKEGRDVLLIDADKLMTSTTFFSVRNEETDNDPGFAAIQLKDDNVRSYLQREGEKYSDIIVDVGGFDSRGQRSALVLADVYLTPFAPRSADIWALEQTEEIVGLAKAVNDNLKAYAFINKADPQGTSNAEAAEVLSDSSDLTYLPTSIVNRKVFGYAMAAGQSISEYRPTDHKALKELYALLMQFVPGLKLPSYLVI